MQIVAIQHTLYHVQNTEICVKIIQNFIKIYYLNLTIWWIFSAQYLQNKITINSTMQHVYTLKINKNKSSANKVN